MPSTDQIIIIIIIIILFIELRNAQNVTEQYDVVVMPEAFIP